MKEVQRDRNTVECERFAEQNGFTGAVGGHFPGLAFPPPPTFVPALPPSALRLSKLGRPPLVMRASNGLDRKEPPRIANRPESGFQLIGSCIISGAKIFRMLSA